MRRKLPLLVLLCLLAGAVVAAAGLPGQTSEEPYRILITNDDGIDSPGIAALVDVLGADAEVVVVAPAGNRSASSHATETLRDPIRVRRWTRPDGQPGGWAVSGAPADAARFGLLEVGRDAPFDLLVSGINDGENVGLLAHISGTVGAAKEALLHGVPAIAVSQSRRRDEWLTAARFTATVVEQVRARGLPPGVLLSINVPAGELAGAVPARMAGSEFRYDGYAQEGSDGDETLYRLRLGFQRPTEGGDTRAFLSGRVTVTPIRLDWTDYDTLAELASWELTLPGGGDSE